MAAPVCADELRKLYDAIVALNTGERAVSVNFGERQVAFSQAQGKDLTTLYRTWWRQCGAGSGYPDLAATAERGPPAIARIV